MERRGQPHELGRADLGTAEIGFDQLHRRASEACAFLVNRRIPTGTYGGAGARGGQPPRATRCPEYETGDGKGKDLFRLFNFN